MPSALEGDLAHFYPSEVLQLLQLAQAVGRLELSRGTERVDLCLHNGTGVDLDDGADGLDAGGLRQPHLQPVVAGVVGPVVHIEVRRGVEVGLRIVRPDRDER